LHENGILIHYNDVALNDLFFLDPQWLCDILATVVTIREINPFAAKGLMKINDLQVLFKGSRFNEGDEIMQFIVDLLGKFELALTWDNEHLLIPSLLPSEAMLKFANQDIRIAILSKEKITNKRIDLINYANLAALPINQTMTSFNLEATPAKNKNEQQLSSLYSNVKLANSFSQQTLASRFNLDFLYECQDFYGRYTAATDNSTKSSNTLPTTSVRRLYCLNYLPTGFFSRLITRILCDNILKECLSELIDIDYSLNDMGMEQKQLESLIDFVCQEAEWKCWQTGIELKYLDYTLVRVKECIFDPLSDLTNKNPNTESSNAISSSQYDNCKYFQHV
jgi:hypothetical protein